MSKDARCRFQIAHNLCRVISICKHRGRFEVVGGVDFWVRSDNLQEGFQCQNEEKRCTGISLPYRSSDFKRSAQKSIDVNSRSSALIEDLDPSDESWWEAVGGHDVVKVIMLHRIKCGRKINSNQDARPLLGLDEVYDRTDGSEVFKGGTSLDKRYLRGATDIVAGNGQPFSNYLGEDLVKDVQETDWSVPLQVFRVPVPFWYLRYVRL